MKRIKYLNSRFLSLILLGIVVSSYFLIKNDKVNNAGVQVVKPSLAVNKNPKKSPLKFSVKNTAVNIGEILSIQHGGGYSFIEVELPSKKILSIASADLPNKLLVGNDVHWENPRLAKNYYSHALKKNFERLYMVTIKNEAIKSGVITSIKAVDGTMFLSVRQEHSALELIVKSERISGELLVGSKVEWQQETISSNQNEYSKNNNLHPQSPLMVDWIRHSKN